MKKSKLREEIESIRTQVDSMTAYPIELVIRLLHASISEDEETLITPKGVKEDWWLYIITLRPIHIKELAHCVLSDHIKSEIKKIESLEESLEDKQEGPVYREVGLLDKIKSLSPYNQKAARNYINYLSTQ